MTDVTATDEIERQKVKRPLGVWILTIWDGFVAGVIPAVSVLILYFSVEAQAALELSGIVVVFSVLLGLAIFAASIEAWRGNNTARIALVVLVTTYYGLLAFSNFRIVTSGILEEMAQQMKVCGRIFRSVFWIGINLWYFLLSERPKEFYGLY